MGRANKQQRKTSAATVGAKRKRNFKQTVSSPYSIDWFVICKVEGKTDQATGILCPQCYAVGMCNHIS